MKSAIRLVVAILLAIGTSRSVFAQSYTLSPSPFLLAQDNTGKIINGACIWTYASGGTTPATTYSDTAGTPNLNPIRSDSAGRFVAYLIAGTNYKFVYESSCVPPAHATVLKTVDPVPGVPASAASVDITATAGESIAAGNAVYWSDGSGGKTAGQIYKADSANAYSSSIAGVVGMAPSAIAAAASGTVRVEGSVTGLSSLSTGSAYYISTSGAITTTAPSNVRFLGTADSATSIVLASEAKPLAAAAGLVLTSNGTTTRSTYQGYMNSVCDVRLTLTSGTPVTTADVTGATNLFITPYKGNKCALYDGSATWAVVSFSEITQPLGTLTSGLPYDVFGTAGSGTMTTELLAWTNTTTRATPLVLQDGVYVKSGAAPSSTRRYLGTIYTTSTTTTEDSAAKRYVWNMYNRVDRPLQAALETADSWNYTTDTWRQANANAANQLEMVVGIAEDAIDVTVIGEALNGTAGVIWRVGIGEDSTSALATGVLHHNGTNTVRTALSATLRKIPVAGRHVYVWLERSVATGTTTFYGDDGGANQSGITGRFKS